MRAGGAIDNEGDAGHAVPVPAPPLDDDALRLLASFAGHGNLRRAATELGLPRSTVSRRLAALEGRIGQAIFLRRGRVLSATAFGERLVAHAKAARDALADVDSAVREARAGGRSLVIAVSPPFAELVLPAVLPDLCARHPGLRVCVALSHGYADIFDDRVDLALRRGPLPSSASLAARRLGKLAMLCVGSPSLAAPGAGPVEDRARELPWIRVGQSLEPFALELATPRGRRSVSVTPRLAVDSQRLALEFVRGGLGVARVNAFLARPWLARGELVEVLPEGGATETVFAVYPRRTPPDVEARDLVARVIDRCRLLDIWEPS